MELPRSDWSVRPPSFVITGAGGNIGSALTNYLRNKRYDVVALTREDWDVTLGCSRVKGKVPSEASVVFHLAAQIGIQKSWTEPDEFFRVNVEGTRSVLEYCRRTNSGLVLMSTYMYSPSAQPPVNENAPIEPLNPYAQTKLLAEELGRFYHQAFGIPVVIARPFNVFGGVQTVEFLIPSIIRQAVGQGRQIAVKDTDPVRDYIYIKDLVAALERIGNGLVSGFLGSCEVFNVGTGIGTSVREVVETIQKVWRIDKPISSRNQPRKNEIPISIADIRKIKQELGWEPGYSLEEGLKDMCETNPRFGT